MWSHRGIFILLADAVGPDDQVYRDVPAVLQKACVYSHRWVGLLPGGSFLGAEISPLTDTRISPEWNCSTAPECWRTWSCTAPGSACSTPGTSAGWGAAAVWAERTTQEVPFRPVPTKVTVAGQERLPSCCWSALWGKTCPIPHPSWDQEFQKQQQRWWLMPYIWHLAPKTPTQKTKASMSKWRTYSNSSKLDFFSSPLGFMSL